MSETKHISATEEKLAAQLDSLADIIRAGACHANAEQLESAISMVGKFLSPANILTTYQVCEQLGVTSRTLYNWIDAGAFPPGKQMAGAGNTRFWYSDEFQEARKKLKKRGYIK